MARSFWILSPILLEILKQYSWRYISGGYSPKLYDSHWVIARQDWLEAKFKHATIYGDTHFRSAAKYFKNVTLVAPKQKPPKRDLDIHDQLKNSEIRAVRGRVESPFGIMENKFGILKKPFYEGEEQLDYLVQFAYGVVAYEKN